MGTALDRATELSQAIIDLAALRGIELPTTQIVQAGTPVIGSCGLIIAAASIAPLVNYDATLMSRCAPPQRANIVGAISREYEVTDEAGIDDPVRLAAASALMQEDGDLLWSAVWEVDAYLGPDSIAVDWNITGGLIISSVSYLVGVK